MQLFRFCGFWTPVIHLGETGKWSEQIQMKFLLFCCQGSIQRHFCGAPAVAPQDQLERQQSWPLPCAVWLHAVLPQALGISLPNVSKVTGAHIWSFLAFRQEDMPIMESAFWQGGSYQLHNTTCLPCCLIGIDVGL